MTLQEFIDKYNGKELDVDGMHQNQCKDLFIAYNIELAGNPNYVWGNARDLLDNAPDEYYEKLSGNPQRGDVVVWGQRPYGHVGIFIEGNGNGFNSFDQNYGGHLEPCQIVNHTYKNVIGFLRPRKGNMGIDDNQIWQNAYRESMTLRQAQLGVVNDPAARKDADFVLAEIKKGSQTAYGKLALDIWSARDKTKAEKQVEEIKGILSNG